MAGKLTDPADTVEEKKEARRMEDEGQVLNISNLSMEDFKAIPPDRAMSSHPFDGYPLGQKVRIGEAQVSSTFIVALHPNFFVHQDPSGKGVSIRKKVGKGEREEKVDIETVHSRVVKAFEEGEANMSYVFDREVQLSNGTLRVTVVPSHTARAQICFSIEPRTGKIQVDPRYRLLDFKQMDRLRRTFNMIHTPQARIERLSKAITGESEEMLEELESTPLEQTE